VALQFSWRVVVDNVADVKIAPGPTETARPATAGPLLIHRDDSRNIRPCSALTAGNTALLVSLFVLLTTLNSFRLIWSKCLFVAYFQFHVSAI